MTQATPQFNPHSRTQRDSGAAADLWHPTEAYTLTPHLSSQEASPEASWRLLSVVICAAVFSILAAFVWWAT